MMNEVKTIKNLAKSASEDWNSDKWLMELNRVAPNWRSIVNNPNHWPYWEDDQSIQGSKNLCDLLIEEAGYYLAERWIESDNDNACECAQDWAMRHSYNFNSFESREMQ